MNAWGWFADLAHTYPFSARMAGHMLLAQVIAPVLLLAVPGGVARRVSEYRMVGKMVSLLRHRSFTWVMGMGAMWVWHLPAACHAVASHPGLEPLEDMCFLVSGIVFWWPIFSPLPRERMNPVPWSVLYLVSGCVSCTLLGILLAFAPPAGHSQSVMASGIPDTMAADQHTGGLIMWVPGCLIYLAAVIAMFARWYTTPEDEAVIERHAPARSELVR